MLKRILSLILVLTLLAGYVPPVYVQAEGIENTDNASVEETIAATEETIQTEEPAATAATQSTTEPSAAATEAATEPAQSATVPEETAAPGEEPTEEAEGTTAPTDIPLETMEGTVTDEAALAVSGSCGENVTWSLSGGTLTVSGTGPMDNCDFNRAPWYESRDSITRIVVESGITEIGNQTFMSLEKVTSVSIPGTVTRIGVRAFRACDGLSGVHIPSSVTTIDAEAFWDCEGLTSITLPEGLTYLGEEAFQHCKRLESVSIPGTVKTISDWAFDDCEVLKNLNIAYGVEVIGMQAFGQCEVLSYVYLPGSVKTIGSHAFWNCLGLETIRIPEGVTEIGPYAFNDCDKMENLTIPGSVQTIGENAFQLCDGLKNVTVCEGVPHIGKAMFYCCYKLEYVELPDSVTGIGNYAFYKTALHSVDFPDNLETVGSDAFSGCANLTEITLPNSVRTVGAGAFEHCTSLRKARLSANMTTLNGIFGYCENLTSVSVPRRIDTVKYSAFSNCTSLTSLVLPGVKELGTYDSAVFTNCPNLTSIYLGKVLTEVGKSAFNGAFNLKDVYFEGSKAEWEAITIGKYNDNLLNATIHYNVPIPADDFYDFKMQPKDKTVTMGYQDELVLQFILLRNGEPMTDWTQPSVMMEDGEILEAAKWEMIEGDWYVTLKPRMLGTEQLTFTHTRAEDTLEVKVTVEPSELKEYLDNTAIHINNSGNAYAYYLGDPGVRYDFTRNGLRDSVVADDKGIIKIPLGFFMVQDTYEIIIEFVGIEGKELETSLPFKAEVTVDPLQFRQEWQLSMDTEAGVSIGGVGIGLGDFKAKASLGSLSMGVGAGAALTLSRTWEDGKETLELISDRSAGAKTGVESGITGEFKAVEADIAHVSAGAEAAGTVAYGLRIQNYSSQNKDHQRALAVFILGEALQLNKNNLLARSFYEDLRQEAFRKAGINTIDGDGVAATGTFNAGYMSLQVGNTPIFSMLDGSMEANAAISQYQYSNGDTKYTTSISTRQNLEAASTLYFDGVLGLDYLGKDITVEVKQEGGNRILETTSLSAEMHKVSSMELGKRYRNDYNQFVFSEESLEELLSNTTNFRSYWNGRRIGVGNRDLTEIAELLSTGKEPVAYHNQEKTQVLYSLPLDFDLELGVGLDLGVDLSYMQTLEHTTKTGFAINDEILITGDSPGNSAAINANSVDLDDLLVDVLCALADDVASFFKETGGKIQDGVKTAWSWIEGKADSAADWVVSITCPDSADGIGWNTSERVDISGELFQNSGWLRSRRSVSGVAATVGRPFVISVTDTGAGKEITDLQAEPLVFTIRYTEEELAAAGFTAADVATDEFFAIYRYDEGNDNFQYVGGTHDADARTVTAEINRTGQYILAAGVEVITEEESPDNGSTEDVPTETETVTHSVTVSQEYVVMQKGQSRKFTAETTWEEQQENIRWYAEDADILAVDTETGEVTALAEGSTYVIAAVTDGVTTISARCRVDVTENQILGIQLSTQKVTTELYSTAYTSFEILQLLPQAETAGMFISDEAAMSVQNNGTPIKSARFADAETAKLFELVMLDDRTAQIVPTDEAIANFKKVKSSYKSEVILTIGKTEHTSEVLTITVKKSTPKVTVKVDSFNSFYSHQARSIAVTGATVTRITADTSKAVAIPEWLTLRGENLILSDKAPAKSISGKVYLLVETEQWRIPAAVVLSVKNTYKAPGLKLSATSVTMCKQAEYSDGVRLQLLCSNKKDALASLNISGITAPAGYFIDSFDRETGEFVLKAESGATAGKITLNVNFFTTDKTLPLNLTVKTAAVALKLAPTTVTLNQAVSDSGEIKVTSTPADFRLENPAIRLTGTETINGKKTTVDKTASGELDIRYENGYIRIRTTDLTPEKASYKLYISAGGSKEAAATINVVTAVPGVTLKATGSMDLSFPTQNATITATFKNYSGRIVSYDCTVAEMKGKTVVDEDVTGKFAIEQDGKTFRIRCTDESLNIANTYAVKLKLILEDGSSLEKSINLKVKRTAVKLKLSAAKLSLNKLIGDTGSINITCTTKGYAFEEPVWTLTDSKNKPAEGELTINYKNGQLTVSTNDATVYGKSYKIVLKANEYGTASTLTVSVPTQAKSIPTVTIKAAGKIDVIRDGSAVTVTPTYKNCITTTHAEETVTISNSKKEDVTSLFTITPNGKGGYTVTKAENAALPTGTYKVKLAANFGAVEIASKEVNMSVAMGAAKLTTVTTDTTLFAKDKNDRALVWFEAADATLNEVGSITFKNAKQAEMFEIIDYGGGLFAIGFKDGEVDKSLLAAGKTTSKTVTVSLNVFVSGNETTKTNATANVKLTIVK